MAKKFLYQSISVDDLPRDAAIPFINWSDQEFCNRGRIFVTNSIFSLKLNDTSL